MHLKRCPPGRGAPTKVHTSPGGEYEAKLTGGTSAEALAVRARRRHLEMSPLGELRGFNREAPGGTSRDVHPRS